MHVVRMAGRKCYGLDGQGFESLQPEETSQQMLQTDCEIHPASSSVGTGVRPADKAAGT
jgi:hypothetical protein